MQGGGYDASDKLSSSGAPMSVVRNEDAVLSVTIRQIQECEFVEGTNENKIDGVVRKQVSIVGRIISSTDVELDHIYEITDGTGKIQVHHTIEDQSTQIFEDNTYVCICGRIRKDKAINAYSVRQVTDFNQISFHILQSLFFHLNTLRGPAPGSCFTTHVSQHSTSSTEAAVHQVAQMTEEEKNEKLKEAVLAFIKAQDSSDGVSETSIITALSDQYSVQDVKAAIDCASYDGSIYQAAAEGHYLLC